MPTVYLGLGSNLGDRQANIQNAITELQLCGAVSAVRQSSLYETDPEGWPGAPMFLNAVIEVHTTLQPHDLLRACKAVEATGGRLSAPRNAPRPIDVDILLYETTRTEDPDLILPHPRLMDRSFVLQPLAEIAPLVSIAPGVTAAEAAATISTLPRLWTGSADAAL